ncbi:MAG: globin [Hyphomonadaceae bacterium]
MGGGAGGVRLEAIEASIDAVSARGDPTALIYAKLFAAHPETEALFARDASGQVRGHMLYEALEAVRDLAGARTYAPHWIASEYVNHQQMQVPAHLFARFFDAIADALEESLGESWTPAMAGAWAGVRADVAALIEERDALGASSQGI